MTTVKTADRQCTADIDYLCVVRSSARWGGGRWGGGRLLLLLLLLITSSEYCEGCQSKKGFRDRGGWLRTRDLQMTNILARLRVVSPPREARTYSRNPWYINSSSTQGKEKEASSRHEREKKNLGHRRRRDLNPRYDGHNQPLRPFGTEATRRARHPQYQVRT